ncbi:hypothetical protein Tco_0778458 [Tanacetum coccineum]
MENIFYRHQQVLNWQRNWNAQDSSVMYSNPLGTQPPSRSLFKLLKATRLKSKSKDWAKSDKKKQPCQDNQKRQMIKCIIEASGSGDELTPVKVRIESWGDSDEEDDDDVGDFEDDAHDDGDDSDEEEEEDSDQNVYTPLDYQLTEEEMNDDEEIMDEEEEDEVTKKLYNKEDEVTQKEEDEVNLGTEDAKMTYADQGGQEQQNVSRVSRFEQVEEDSYVIVTPVLDAQKVDDPMQAPLAPLTLHATS